MEEKIEKLINASFIENIFKDFYDGDWFAESDDWVKLDRIATNLKNHILKVNLTRSKTIK